MASGNKSPPDLLIPEASPAAQKDVTDMKLPDTINASPVQTIARAALCALSIGAAAMSSTVSAGAAGDPARGQVLYKDCQLCHSIDQNGTGPMHRGVVGRPAGSVAGFDYSPALKNAKIVWTEANLDKWLADPEAFIPGNKMFFNVDSGQDRADIIAFLKERAK